MDKLSDTQRNTFGYYITMREEHMTAVCSSMVACQRHDDTQNIPDTKDQMAVIHALYYIISKSQK